MVSTADEAVFKSNPCRKVEVVRGIDMWDSCKTYLNLPMAMPENDKCAEWKVPLIYHAVGKEVVPPRPVIMNAATNPKFVFAYRGDWDAREFVRTRCGIEAAAAYDCFVAPAYKADLFRYCALYTEGGVYVDSDLVLARPFEQTVDMCGDASVGHDIPQMPLPPRNANDKLMPGLQMKIVSGPKQHPLFKCMLDEIVRNVRSKLVTRYPLLLTGPALLARCYMAVVGNTTVAEAADAWERTRSVSGWPRGYFDGQDKTRRDAGGVHIVYRDTRAARWPYSGMVGPDGLIAFEFPSKDSYDRGDLISLANATQDQVARAQKHYHELMMQGLVFKETCSL